MKALSIRQPWAWLIVKGYKDIENRKWSTTFKGKFLIHTGKSFDDEGYRWIKAETTIELPNKDEFDKGGVIGIAEITDCVSHHSSPWFFGPFGFVIQNPEELEFSPARGKLGFFNLDETELNL